MTIETPNGKLKFFSQNLSAPKSLPKTPLSAETLTLFSDSGFDSGDSHQGSAA